MTVPKLSSNRATKSRQRIYWKATLRSAPPLAFILLGEWHQQIRIFRWKWLATAAARLHKRRWRRELLKEAVVEPYSPGANVIPFNVSPTSPGKLPGQG